MYIWAIPISYHPQYLIYDISNTTATFSHSRCKIKTKTHKQTRVLCIRFTSLEHKKRYNIYIKVFKCQQPLSRFRRSGPKPKLASMQRFFSILPNATISRGSSRSLQITLKKNASANVFRFLKFKSSGWYVLFFSHGFPILFDEIKHLFRYGAGYSRSESRSVKEAKLKVYWCGVRRFFLLLIYCAIKNADNVAQVCWRNFRYMKINRTLGTFAFFICMAK